MKTILTFFLGLTLFVSTYGQSYTPTVADNKQWDVLSITLQGFFDTTYATISYSMTTDTSLASGVYKKVYSSAGGVPGNWSLFCYMREDANRRVWFKQTPVDNEVLMYDYTVQAGDSLIAGISGMYLHIDSVTHVTIGGILRQKFWISCKLMPQYHETWTEGIGSSRGIIFSGSELIVGGWYWFLCMSQEGVLVYMNPAYNSCYLVSGINEKDSQSVTVYPNPAGNILNLTLPGDIRPSNICLIDALGNKVAEFSPGQTSLDVSNLQAGVYVLKLSHEKGMISRKVLIR